MLVVDGMLTLLPVTVSSLSIALVLLVLLGRHGVRAAWAFVAGWFAASWLVLLLGMLGVSGLADRAGGTAAGLPPLVQVGVGVAAVATGGVLLARRRRRRGSAPSPELARLARLADGLTPLRSALLGFALVALSVRQWLFLVPAAGFFSAAAVAGGRAWLPVLGAVVASLGVAVPVVIDGAMVRKHACIDGPEIDSHIIDWDKFLPRFGQFRAQEKQSLIQHGLG